MVGNNQWLSAAPADSARLTSLVFMAVPMETKVMATEESVLSTYFASSLWKSLDRMDDEIRQAENTCAF